MSRLEPVDPVTMMTGTTIPPPTAEGSQGTGPVIEEMLSRVDLTTPPTVKGRLRALMYKYSKAFSTTNWT